MVASKTRTPPARPGIEHCPISACPDWRLCHLMGCSARAKAAARPSVTVVQQQATERHLCAVAS